MSEETKLNFYINQFSPKETSRTFEKRTLAKRESLFHYFDDEWFDKDVLGRIKVRERGRN